MYFPDMEMRCAQNFANYLQSTSAKQTIYLSGIVNDGSLSKHLRSRLRVEDVLRESGVPLTVLRAAIIIGSGSEAMALIWPWAPIGMWLSQKEPPRVCCVSVYPGSFPDQKYRLMLNSKLNKSGDILAKKLSLLPLGRPSKVNSSQR